MKMEMVVTVLVLGIVRFIAVEKKMKLEGDDLLMDCIVFEVGVVIIIFIFMVLSIRIG